MKRILLTGVQPGITEDTVRRVLADVGSVSQITIVRDGNPDRPLVVVEMSISAAAAHLLVARLTDYWLDGSRLSAHLLMR